MSKYYNNILNYTYSLVPTDYEQLLFDNLYKHIELDDYLIGGSYSLKQYIDDTTWEANDIDMFIKMNYIDVNINTIQKTFETYSNKLNFKNYTIIYNQYFHWNIYCLNYAYRPVIGGYARNNLTDVVEDFDKSIIAVATFNTEQILGKKLQIVLLEPRVYGINNLYKLLKKIVDIPVFYRGYLFSRNWYVPKSQDKYIRYKILTKPVCSKRIEKYERRGFTILNKFTILNYKQHLRSFVVSITTQFLLD